MRRIQYGIVLIGCVLGFTFGFFASKIGNRIVAKDTTTAIEVGMKISDLKWLLHEGEISEKELKKFQTATSIEEMNEVLDSILKDKSIPEVSIN